MTLRVVSLCSGVGGFELGLERAGMHTVAFVEKDPYAQRILSRHWPDIHVHDDVFSAGRHSLPGCDVIAAGIPCQPHSLAGARQGESDERWLWPEVNRIVSELRPRYVVIENVPPLRRSGLGAIVADLMAQGYCVEWDGLAATDVGAPHLRDRLFVVAWMPAPGTFPDAVCGYLREQRERRTTDVQAFAGDDGAGGQLADGKGDRRHEWWSEPARDKGRHGAARRGELSFPWCGRLEERHGVFGGWSGAYPPTSALERWALEPEVGRTPDGAATGLDGARWPVLAWERGVPRTISRGVDRNRVARLRCVGNAVVPAVGEVIGRLVVAHSRSNPQRSPTSATAR